MQENYIKNLFYEFSILDSNSFIKFKEAISILIRNDRMNDLNSIIEKCTYEQILSSNPNIPKEKLLNLANSISSILKAYIHKVFLKILHSKVMEFESEEEAQELFKKIYHKELDKANKNLYPQEIIDLIYEYYDLCKYDKKLIIDDKPYFYNLYHMWIEYKLHKKALIKWQILAKAKVPEHNFNISHNTNKSIADKVKFLTPAYKPYMDNPFFKDEQKELEYNLIQEFVADNEAMARAVSSINSLNVDVDTLNDSDILKIVIKSYQNNKHVLNSNTTIDYQMIERSWLTNVAFIHLKLNKSCMPVQKLSKFITTIAKATTKTYKNTSKKQIFTYSKLSNADFREVNIFYNLRLKELTDNRKEIKGSQGFIDEFSNFTDCISDKVHKMGIK